MLAEMSKPAALGLITGRLEAFFLDERFFVYLFKTFDSRKRSARLQLNNLLFYTGSTLGVPVRNIWSHTEPDFSRDYGPLKQMVLNTERFL